MVAFIKWKLFVLPDVNLNHVSLPVWWKGLRKSCCSLFRPCYRPLLYHFQRVLIQKGWLPLARSSGSFTALSLVNFCSLSLPRWIEALLLSHYIKKIKLNSLIYTDGWLSQSAYPWQSIQTSWEASYWLPLCYCNMLRETPALQLACMLWCWMLTIPGDKSQWKLGKVLQLEPVSRCVTKP